MLLGSTIEDTNFEINREILVYNYQTQFFAGYLIINFFLTHARLMFPC